MFDKFIIAVIAFSALLGAIYFFKDFVDQRKCERMYTTEEDIGECLWLLRNG